MDSPHRSPRLLSSKMIMGGSWSILISEYMPSDLGFYPNTHKPINTYMAKKPQVKSIKKGMNHSYLLSYTVPFLVHIKHMFSQTHVLVLACIYSYCYCHSLPLLLLVSYCWYCTVFSTQQNNANMLTQSRSARPLTIAKTLYIRAFRFVFNQSQILYLYVYILNFALFTW